MLGFNQDKSRLITLQQVNLTMFCQFLAKELWLVKDGVRGSRADFDSTHKTAYISPSIHKIFRHILQQKKADFCSYLYI